MQIGSECFICPNCGAAELEKAPVVHHMICAYVGPEYDFGRTADALLCPKCRRTLREGGRDWEVVSTCALCRNCGGEFVVSDPPSGPQGRPDPER